MLTIHFEILPSDIARVTYVVFHLASHFGFQVETTRELEATRAAWDARGLARADQDDLVCGYQRQDKSWVWDPQQLPWEVFVTHGVADDYGTTEMPAAPGADGLTRPPESG